MRYVVFWTLQPVLTAGALLLAQIQSSGLQHFFFIICAFLFISVLEQVIPARKEWRSSNREKLKLLSFVMVAVISYGLVEAIYEETVFAWMTSLRIFLDLEIWPSDRPFLLQVFLVFAGYEFVNYWYHRGAHRWKWLWHLSGHGTHHAFKKLNALNALANHPIESAFLILPRAVVGFLLGGEELGLAVASLTAITALLAHCNLNLNSRVIGWIFTTNQYHIHHHSRVVAESQKNYGCVCIIWDRLFGTFRDAYTEEAGIGSYQPSYKELYLMPFKR